jgi:tetratricopeptide (TPR) repeat protein
MNRLIILVFLSLTSSVCSFGQTDWSYSFQRAKEVYQAGKYDLAMEMFLPVTTPDAGNPYASYAQYYYGLSAYKAKKYQESRQMLLQLLNRVPNWEDIREVEFLLAADYWELGQYRQAMAYMKPLENLLNASVVQMKRKYYATIQPVDTLIKIQKDFPNDDMLAQALYSKIMFATDPKQKMLAAYLAQEYKITSTIDKKDFQKKKEYHVAVLLPFLIQDLKMDDGKQSNQYVIEIYRGIMLAVDSLKKNGVNIVVHPYDTKTDVETLKKIMSYAEMKQMDLIIGPLVPVQMDLMTTFSEMYKIPVVNPISLNSKITESTHYTLLFQPVLETYAGTVAKFAEQNFIYRKNVDKDNDAIEKRQVLIFYSPDKKDSLLAAYYKDSVQSRGFKVVAMNKVTNRNISMVATQVFTDSISLLKTSHIFVASSDPTVASYIVSQVEISKQTVPLVVKSDWLEFNVTFDQFERRKVYFMYPDYVQFYSPVYQSFHRHYVEKTKLLPTRFAIYGYEIMFQLGSLMGEYGIGYFTVLTSRIDTKGVLLYGMNFTNQKFNSYLPLVYFQNLQLIPANPIQ